MVENGERNVYFSILSSTFCEYKCTIHTATSTSHEFQSNLERKMSRQKFHPCRSSLSLDFISLLKALCCKYCSIFFLLWVFTSRTVFLPKTINNDRLKQINESKNYSYQTKIYPFSVLTLRWYALQLNYYLTRIIY